MKILLNNIDLNEALYGVSNIGFVPTMGSIHNGHISLIKRSLRECKKTIVSIFINPTQFNNKKDYKIYPRNNKRDLLLLKKLKVNFVFLPDIKDIYKSRILSKKRLKSSDKILCAKFRKGHFEGVIEVMDRLTKIIKPQKIFMGEKDYQQLFLVKKFIEKKYKSKVISCKIIRDKNKLALSSRNIHLKKMEKNKAGKIANILFKFKRKLDNKRNIKKLLFLKKEELKRLFNIKIEYLELRNKKNLKLSKNIQNSKIFIAYYMNKVRLIDNY